MIAWKVCSQNLSETEVINSMPIWEKLQKIKHIKTTMQFIAGGKSGILNGTVQLTLNGNSIIFDENSSWDDNSKIKTSNKMQWNIKNDMLLLSHLRSKKTEVLATFQIIESNNQYKTVSANYKCINDIYIPQLSLENKLIQLTWIISGPKKNGKIIYLYY